MLTYKHYEVLADWLEGNFNLDYYLFEELYQELKTTNMRILFRGIRREHTGTSGNPGFVSMTDNPDVAMYFAKVENDYDAVGFLGNTTNTQILVAKVEEYLDVTTLSESGKIPEDLKYRFGHVPMEREYITKLEYLNIIQELNFTKVDDRMVEVNL